MNTASLQLFHDGANSLLYFQEGLGQQEPSCVVKVMKEGLGIPSRVAAFYNEFEIAKGLQVEGVPRYLRKDQLDGRPAIVLEYFEGKPLSMLFGSGRKAPLGDFLRIATQAARILAGIHAQQVIHKDINANNILYHAAAGQVRIIDFGISSKFDMRKQHLGSPDALEGTLAYISPEQTGRMNRVVDQRTDLYSLGVTFYEMLTGRLPFPASDPMELVHCHLARSPLPPCEVDAAIPAVVSDLVMRLLEKSASDRYQSAAGLSADLERCQAAWEAQQRIEPFPLGQHDHSDRLHLSQKLYGCQDQLDELLEAFRRVSQGAVELVLVSGYSGAGKSSLVQEVHGPVVEKRGYFIHGKHDQYQRATPYAALIQAFNHFVEQVLTESPQQIERWKARILEGVGENGSILIDVIPHLQYIIGRQAEAEKLPPAEAANRFNYVFRRFIEAISLREHPLVIFLDDLQWADAATLNSIKMLLSDRQNQYLLLIGAYRSNEVGPTHPLSYAIDELARKGAAVSSVELRNLSEAHVLQLTADSLRAEPAQVEALASVVHAKTQGNAFFVGQFLQALHEQGVLYFDRARLAWAWDAEALGRQHITNNVVELMAGKIEKQPPQTREVLQLAACIGDSFELTELAGIYGRSLPETFHALWKAVEEGLVLPLDDNYRIVPALSESPEVSVDAHFQFLHDRVQQAAYQLTPEPARARLHYRIGKSMLERLPEAEQAVRVFDLVNQLNAGEALVEHGPERRRLAALNRLAAQKAKDATAYEAAYDYLAASLRLLGDTGWEQDYDETLLAHIDMAEVAYLVGKRVEMDGLVGTILRRAATPLDQVRAYEVKSQAHIANSEMREAVDTALKVLRLLGIRFPSRPNKLHILQYLAKLQLALRGHSTASLLALPKMEDLNMRAAVRILSATAIAAYFEDKGLYALFAVKQVLLALRYGNAYTTPSAYASVALIYSGVLRRYDRGYFFGELALKLMKQRHARKLHARIGMIFHAIISPWKRHAAAGIEALKDSFQKGMDSGDFEYGLHAALEYVLCSIYTGRPAVEVFETNKKFYATAQQLNQKDPKEVLQVLCQAYEHLIQPETGCSSFLKGNFLDEEVDLPRFEAERSVTVLACAYVLKYYLATLFDEPDAVEKHAKRSFDHVEHVAGTVARPILLFSDSMSRARLCARLPEAERKAHLRQIKANQRETKHWAKHAPMNFAHRYWLIEAELAALKGRLGKAGAYYKQAIHLAQENDFPNDQALALERFADFCLARDNRPVAGLYLRKAYVTYQKWGAQAKLQLLRERHYDLLLPDEAPDLSSREVEMMETPGQHTSLHTSLQTMRRSKTSGATSSSAGMHSLDFSTLMKTANALAREVNLEALQQQVLAITIENAGAQQGMFVRQGEKEALYVAAAQFPEGAAQAEAVGMPTAECPFLPSSIVNYVARTHKALVLAQAMQDSTYSFDPYIKANRPLSVMCFPILSQGQLRGIIYLENNLIADAFTEERLEVLNLLSAQIGIALENAALYNSLEQKVAERTAALHASNDALTQKNQHITDSIRYAQTIQAAVLPSAEELQEAFADYFLLYRPKDIVSGDFYWMKRHEGATYVAVADCTGHGVPGAFMSMIGMALLDEMLLDKGISEPAQMLETLHQGIRAGLRQHQTDNDDGMDVCLCSISPLPNGQFALRYAGAKRPLYFYVDGEGMHCFKGTNKTIGGFFKKHEATFAEECAFVPPGTTLYLSSDGYIDQANTMQKKIGTGLLLQLLEGNAQLPMAKQHEVLEKILDLHAAGAEQRDDITILGLKL